jgi:hypothetical protein
LSKDRVRQTIEARIAERGLEMKSLSTAIGRNHAYLYQFLRKGTPQKLDEDDRRKLAPLLGLDESDLRERANSDGGAAKRPSGFSTTLEFEGENYAALPRYDIRVGAGGGFVLPPMPAVASRILFRLDWLRRVTRAPLDQLAVVEVEGDSMEPTLRSGDNVLVDLSERNPGRRDAIYVIGSEDSLQIKRLQVHPTTKRLTIKSDNPAYETWHDIDPKKIDIVGRVIWIGRQV